VNPPELQLIVSSTKAAENDPGSSQGSGVAYEKLPDGQHPESADSSEPQDDTSAPERERPKLALVPAPEQIGLGEVVVEYYEKKRETAPRQDASRQYQANESGAASKGLLLNRKAE